MSNTNSKVEELFEQLRKAQHKIEAQQKTIDVLTTRALDKQLHRDSAFALLEENSALQDVVNRKTVELEEQNQKLEDAHRALKQTQTELIQAQKLESIGRLAAGVAHEINTPVQYISDNISFIQDSFPKLEIMHKIVHQLTDNPSENLEKCEKFQTLKHKLNELKIDSIIQEIPDALDDAIEGANRVSKIVNAMKEFSHPGSKDKTVSDVNKAIQTTIAVTRNEWKYVADINFKPDTSLKPFPFYLSEFNQCVLNLIINSAHAIEEHLQNQNRLEEEKGTITIKTFNEESHVMISIGDNGTGIPDDIVNQIFDPFFTTKAPGKGTGQGLTFVYNNIVNKHKGSLNIQTKPGEGTTFYIRIPIEKA